MQSLSTAEQVRAILDGTIVQRIKAIQPRIEDYRTAVTATRTDLESYFLQHPSIADSLLTKKLHQERTDERIIILQTRDGYQVGVSDHEQPIFLTSFASKEKALANMLFWELGL
jgi:hypothetical protein